MDNDDNDPIPGSRPEADPISPTQIIEAQDMPADPAPSAFIVIHNNEHGHAFATRVSATSQDAARASVLAAHEDNSVLEVLPDDGRETHGYGGRELPVIDLNDEP